MARESTSLATRLNVRELATGDAALKPSMYLVQHIHIERLMLFGPAFSASLKDMRAQNSDCFVNKLRGVETLCLSRVSLDLQQAERIKDTLASSSIRKVDIYESSGVTEDVLEVLGKHFEVVDWDGENNPSLVGSVGV